MSGDRIFLWAAGHAAGTAGSVERAQAIAGEYLGGDVARALVEEAAFVMGGAGDEALTTSHQRTGRAWRGRLSGGEAVWEPAPDGGA